MKWLILFSGKNEKNIDLSSAEFAQRTSNVQKAVSRRLCWKSIRQFILLPPANDKAVDPFIMV